MYVTTKLLLSSILSILRNHRKLQNNLWLQFTRATINLTCMASFLLTTCVPSLISDANVDLRKFSRIFDSNSCIFCHFTDSVLLPNSMPWLNGWFSTEDGNAPLHDHQQTHWRYACARLDVCLSALSLSVATGDKHIRQRRGRWTEG